MIKINENQDRQIYNAFERALLDLEEDIVLKDLVKPRHGRGEEGVLRSMVNDLRTFADKHTYGGRENDLDQVNKQAELKAVFDNTMKAIVKNWSALAARGVNWDQLCRVVYVKFMAIAQVFELDQSMAQAMDEWFVEYQRDSLKAEALAAHQAMAYVATVGAPSLELRKRIAAIDQALASLPPEREPVAAFSRQSSPAYSEQELQDKLEEERRANQILARKKFGGNIAYKNIFSGVNNQVLITDITPKTPVPPKTEPNWKEKAKKMPVVGWLARKLF